MDTLPCIHELRRGAMSPAPIPGWPRPAAGARAQARPEGRLKAYWARDHAEVLAAQRLRYQVFVGEMGARPSSLRPRAPGLDQDRFDAYCEHLLIRVLDEAGRPGAVVGTYRVLTPAAARAAGGLYTAQEFDLARLEPWRDGVLELGRSCVHPQWRTGGVILMLWQALMGFMRVNGLRHMLGCASVSMADGGHEAASLWRQLQCGAVAPESLWVRPHRPLPLQVLDANKPVQAPPLIKGYLRCGAKVLGPPAWDPEFGVADLPMWLDLNDLAAPYGRRFMGRETLAAAT